MVSCPTIKHMEGRERGNGISLPNLDTQTFTNATNISRGEFNFLTRLEGRNGKTCSCKASFSPCFLAWDGGKRHLG